MKWQREEKAKPLDLANTGEKISITAQLQAYTAPSSASRYQKIKDLKAFAGVMSFLEDNHIETTEDFHSKIDDMNKSFYVLKGELSKTQADISNIDRQLDLWQQHKNAKPLLEKYTSLTGAKKQTFYKQD